MRLLRIIAIAATFMPAAMLAQGSAPTQERPYFDFQVDKAVQTAPDSPAPRYPETLRSAGIQGEVLVQFVVDTAGQYEPGSLKIIRSEYELFSGAVRNALPKIKFVPAELGGRKVRQIVQQPFTFSLAR